MPGADATATTLAAGRRHRAAAICLGSVVQSGVVVAQPSLAVTRKLVHFFLGDLISREISRNPGFLQQAYFEMNFAKS